MSHYIKSIKHLNEIDDALSYNCAGQNTKVILDFNADWCIPCKMLEPVLDKLLSTRDDIVICSVDIDNAPDLVAEFSIKSVPTLVLLENKKEVKRKVGSAKLNDLIKWIDE